MRDARDRAVVFRGDHRDQVRAAVQRQPRDPRPRVGVGAGVDPDRPGRALEQVGTRCRPTRFGGTGHRMAAHVARPQLVLAHGGGDRALHADHIGERAVGRELFHIGQDRCEGGHRHADHHQRIGRSGPGKYGFDIAVHVEPVGAGGAHTGLRTVVPQAA